MVINENEQDSLNGDKLSESKNSIKDTSIHKSSDESAEKTPEEHTNSVEGARGKPKSVPEIQEASRKESMEKVAEDANAKSRSKENKVKLPNKQEEEEAVTEQPATNIEPNDDVVEIKEENERELVQEATKKQSNEIPEPNVTSGSSHLSGDSKSEETKSEKSVTEEAKSETGAAEDDSDEEVDEDTNEEAHLDYSNYTKKQMVQVLESLLKEDDFSQVGRILKEIKKPYDILVGNERRSAYNTYIEDGGEKDGFEYRFDELDQRFNNAYNKLKERKNSYYNSLEKQKENNLNSKLEILEKLRELVDSEETGASIKELKILQEQWKEVGMIPSSQVKSLWANYNALLDRFYDQRSIYFELKELDRKKNYDLKIDICERAEQLEEQDNLREVIKQLNELHEEFKHVGPAPKEDQDKIWDRFKAASDIIYSRRKEYFDKLKDEQKLNEIAKEALVEKVILYADFNSDRISDWNVKTKEIIAIQKEWEKIGSIPKERAKLINKKFWSSFKSFFNKKGQFFKKIEEERKANLVLKQKLVEKAEELKDSDDFKNTSEELKRLQKQWKDIGPVPEKYRNEVFFKFKKACDHFFDRRRSNTGKIEKDYEENLKKKKILCDELEKMVKDEKIDIDRVKSIEKEWSQIGYVPKTNIKSLLKRYTDIIAAITDNIDIPDTEKHKMRFTAQFSNLNFGPGAEKFIHKKEGALRRQISTLENDISLWKNNIDFFASSKNADKLKEEFQVKIDKALEELKNLKDQLKVISNI